MDLWTALQAVILGVVEGLTEFLPISSTGHQIVVADLLGFGGERRWPSTSSSSWVPSSR